MELRLYRFLPRTRAEGPGVRACVQVQGCPIRCAGCGVPQTWTADGGRVVSVNALAGWILAEAGLEGVTFMGGEPFAQAAGVAYVARRAREAGLSVMTFTGFWLEELRAAGRADFEDLLAATDVLVDGPFVKAEADLSRPWVGSRNQRFHFLSPRYAGREAELLGTPNRVEVRIAQDGRVWVNGMLAPREMVRLVRG